MRQSHLRSIGKISFHPRSQIGNALVKDSRLGQHRVEEMSIDLGGESRRFCIVIKIYKCARDKYKTP